MKRAIFLRSIDDEFKINPVVALLGPRQSGKTTLAEQYIKSLKGEVHKFDLEDPGDLASLQKKSLRNKDRQAIIYQYYCKKVKKVSEDEFIGVTMTPGYFSFFEEHKEEIDRIL